ncbi:unnamed protein product [Adineta ricciae]|uniref:Uncharacterized protein n=1 Tax=Adineta ricciae TaxID=249248 RepID=A0A814SNF2_ADIRI|nr:unnamed protein product [Adineta ricciae]CAF1271087.1 unnamed protein product [Adineta ricciae]
MSIVLIVFLSILRFTRSQEIVSPYVFADCKHLILPPRCQCYHSGHESQLRCLKSELHSLPKLPNNMRWDALDFSLNYITSVDSYVFADIYVEKISLKSNYLRRIEPTAFDRIKNLKQLYINHNQLRELHPQALISPGSSLEIFDVSYNLFQYLNIGEILVNLPMLKQFHLVSCHLNSTSIYTLLKLTETTINDTIQRTGHYSLELLDLSSNNLTTICHGLFDALYNLVELRLQHNSIRLVDNNFLRSLTKIKILNLAHNSLEHAPRLASQTLETLNFSSNHIQYLNDYFASNLPSIQIIDLDSNQQLNSTSTRAFCFLNLNSIEKLTFRSNNLLTLNTFAELLCRLTNQTSKFNVIDINHNMNLKCNCTLIQFQNYLYHFNDLTCTHQGQDRYYISKLLNWYSNCQMDFCMIRHRLIQPNYCNQADAERIVYEGTCEAKLSASEERKRLKAKFTSTMTTLITNQWFDNTTDSRNRTWIDNSTKARSPSQQRLGNSVSWNQSSLLVFIFSFLLLLL